MTFLGTHMEFTNGSSHSGEEKGALMCKSLCGSWFLGKQILRDLGPHPEMLVDYSWCAQSAIWDVGNQIQNNLMLDKCTTLLRQQVYHSLWKSIFSVRIHKHGLRRVAVGTSMVEGDRVGHRMYSSLVWSAEASDDPTGQYFSLFSALPSCDDMARLSHLHVNRSMQCPWPTGIFSQGISRHSWGRRLYTCHLLPWSQRLNLQMDCSPYSEPHTLHLCSLS